jgi:predicted secreted protein
MAHPTTGFINGSDLLLHINTGTADTPIWTPVAHTTSHTVDSSSETKDRMTKDLSSGGKWKAKSISGLSVSITCEGLLIYDPTFTYKDLLAKWKAADPVLLKYGFRQGIEQTGDTYEEGEFVITSLSQTTPAGEDGTFSATFENSGEVFTKIVT